MRCNKLCFFFSRTDYILVIRYILRRIRALLWIFIVRSGLQKWSARKAEFYMYAVFQSGGKQHRVSEGQTIRLEKLDIATGETIEFDQVLMIANGEEINIGAPLVDGGKIKAEIIAHGRGEKIKIVKFRRRKHYRKQQGHRQWFTDVKITGISA